jgi:hypothetical protein
VFSDRDLRVLVSTCTTFGLTRDAEGNSRLAYSYADFQGAAEKIGMRNIPAATDLFRMLRDIGFEKAPTAGKYVRIAAPLKLVARIAVQVAMEIVQQN